MFCKRCFLGLVIQLYIAILSSPGTATKTVGDYISYDEKHSFDVALKTLAEIRDKECLPCFSTTQAWPGPSVSFSIEKEKLFHKKDCRFQGNCHRFGKKICYSWNIMVILGQEKYLIFSRIPANTEDNNYMNITCSDAENSNQSKGFNDKQENCSNSLAKEISDVHNDNRRNDHSSGLDKKKIGKASQGKQPRYNEITAKAATDLETGNGRDDHLNASGIQNKMDLASSSRSDVVFPLFTHLIAAIVGAGIVSLVPFIRKVCQRRNKSTRNTGILNASYSGQDSITAITTNAISYHSDEDVYHEVSDTMQSVSKENRSCSPSSTRQVLIDYPKRSKLPDIPQESKKDTYNCLTSEPMKEVNESDGNPFIHSHLHGINRKENVETLSDKNIKNGNGTLNALSKISEEACIEESMEHDYFVLQKDSK
ncbi:uncharacterized protein LOC134235661 isoform X1 [Saccostrea cucullata]|uniref:uncharacterized protein LOC134235661 isoform X1 n=1 Tax=Saccostrea cuccullata TaxID=36930 RepID=UPI002ED202FB